MTEILWFKSKQEQEIFVGCPKCQTDFRHSQSPIPLVPMALSQMLGQEVAHSPPPPLPCPPEGHISPPIPVPFLKFGYISNSVIVPMG